MQYKIGQRVRAKKDLVDEDFPGEVYLEKFTKREQGYIAGVVTYEPGGPVHFLISKPESPVDWFEFKAPEFWRSFDIIH